MSNLAIVGQYGPQPEPDEQQINHALWELAWPYLQRRMLWNGYATTELHRTDTEKWLDWKAAIDGYIITHDDRLESYQWKLGTESQRREFTVRNSTRHGWRRTEWEKLQDRSRPDWWVKVYGVRETIELVELAIIETRHVVDAINHNLARLEHGADGSYWAVDWDAVEPHAVILGPAATRRELLR